MPFYKPSKTSSGGGGFLGALDREESAGQKGFYAAVNKTKSSADLDSVDGLIKLARQKGLMPEATEIVDEEKLSMLQRLSVGLGSLNPAEAIARQSDGVENFLTAYPKTVVQGIFSALTGTDYGEQTKRRFFGDLVKDMGIENKVARFGIGLVGDILLDPSTYVGGALVRGGLKGVSKAATGGLKVVGKVAPEVERGLTIAGQGAKDAIGEMFVYGYGATKGLANDALTFIGEKSKVLKGLAQSNLRRLGTGVLDDRQAEEFVGKLISGKNAQLDLVEQVEDEMIDAFNKKFPSVRFPLKDKRGAINRMENLSIAIPKKIGSLQALRDKLAQPFIAGDLMGLKATVTELKKELAELLEKEVVKKQKPKAFMATKTEMDNALMNALSSEKDKYTNMILGLKSKIASIESGIIEPAESIVTKEVANNSSRYTVDEILQGAMRKLDPKLAIKDTIADLDRQILRVQNEMLEKNAILESVLGAKKIAKERIKKAFDSGDFSSLPEDIASALRPVSDDPVVQKALTEQIRRNAETARKAHIDDPFQVYFPSLAKDKLQKFMYNTRRVALGSEGWRKEYKNLLRDDELLRNPAEAFFRVESEIATNNLTRSFMDRIVEDYGQPLAAFKSEAEAEKAGFKVLKEKGLFGKEVGYLAEKDWKFINGQISANYGAIDALAKSTGFDTATSLFKRFVTGIFAPFHIRNWISGKIQNYEALGPVALNPKTIATGNRIATRLSRGAFRGFGSDAAVARVVSKNARSFGNETIELAGKTWHLDDIANAIENRFGGSSRYVTEFNSITGDANLLQDAGAFSNDVLKSWGKSFKTLSLSKNPVEGLLGEQNPMFRAARVIGGWTELSQKSEAVIGALTKGMSLEDALKVAEKAGFDYRALTPFESHIMRRIIPFYAFTRKNVELQLKTLGQNPQRINQVIRSVENVQNTWESNLTAEEKENLPAYIKEYLSAPVGRTKEGVPQFVRNFGTPIEAFTELVKFGAEGKSGIERTFLATLSKVNPYIKVPIELGIGQDSFRQRDIKEVYNAREYEMAPQLLKDFMRIKEVTKKDFKTGIPRTTYVADPERLLVVRSLFTSRGFTYFNNVFNGNIEGFFRIMDLLSGIRVTEVDIDRQAGFTDRQKREDLGDLLRRNGVVSEFNKLFIPKEK